MKRINRRHIITAEEVEKKILKIRGKDVILDRDVAKLYGVETKAINKAVKNNPNKFPEGYIISLKKNEKAALFDEPEENLLQFDAGADEPEENLLRFASLKHSTTMPKAFTEKGLYMLATILKGEKATATTLSIIETFGKTKEIVKTIKQIPMIKEDSPEYKKMVSKAGELVGDLITPEQLVQNEAEASIEFNLALVKFKYRIHKTVKQ